MQVKVIIEPDVYKKVMHWVNRSQFEVSGLGTLLVEPDGVLRVVSAMLLPQKNKATHTEIGAKEVGEAQFDLRNAPGLLKWWWHSHVQMPVFWSGEDMSTIYSFGEDGWNLATVFNQKNDIKSAFYSPKAQETPWGNLPLFLDNLDTRIQPVVDARIPEWDAEYNRNVTNESWVTQMVPTVGRTQTTAGTQRDTSPCKKISKKERKRLKKEQKTLEEQFGIDAFGLTQSERSFLADGGFDEKQVAALNEDFTPIEILMMAEQGFKPNEMLGLIAEGFGVNDIMEMVKDGRQVDDDIPVADRGRAC